MGRKKSKSKSEGAAKSNGAPHATTATATRSSGHATPRFTEMVPVRFEPAMLDEVRRRADADGRSVSAWIRRAVEAELRRDFIA